VPRDPQQRPGSLTTARKPTPPPDKPLREWRISIMREKVHYLERGSLVTQHGGTEPCRAKP
jgi:hypothetical protein